MITGTSTSRSNSPLFPQTVATHPPETGEDLFLLPQHIFHAELPHQNDSRGGDLRGEEETHASGEDAEGKLRGDGERVRSTVAPTRLSFAARAYHYYVSLSRPPLPFLSLSGTRRQHCLRRRTSLSRRAACFRGDRRCLRAGRARSWKYAGRGCPWEQV